MPCDRQITVTVDLGLADRTVLKTALEAEFNGVRIDASSGALVAYDRQYGRRFAIDRAGALKLIGAQIARTAVEAVAVGLANDVKRAYTRATLAEVGSKFGFALETDGQADARLGQTRFKLTKAVAIALMLLAGIARTAGAHPTIEQKRPCHDERPCVIDAGQHHEEGPKR